MRARLNRTAIFVGFDTQIYNVHKTRPLPVTRSTTRPSRDPRPTVATEQPVSAVGAIKKHARDKQTHESRAVVSGSSLTAIIVGIQHGNVSNEKCDRRDTDWRSPNHIAGQHYWRSDSSA